MIYSIGQLLAQLFAGRTIAADLSDGRAVWRIVETGEPLYFDPIPHLSRWPSSSALEVIQRDLLGEPYQLGLRTPPQGGRGPMNRFRGPERASATTPAGVGGATPPARSNFVR